MLPWSLPIGSYGSCNYEKDCYIGIIQDLSSEENDFVVRFLHPKGPATYFHWPVMDYPTNKHITSILLVSRN